jgi:hypothetical protein
VLGISTTSNSRPYAGRKSCPAFQSCVISSTAADGSRLCSKTEAKNSRGRSIAGMRHGIQRVALKPVNAAILGGTFRFLASPDEAKAR